VNLGNEVQDRFNWIVFLGVEPQFDPLRGVDGLEHLVGSLGVVRREQGKATPRGR